MKAFLEHAQALAPTLTETRRALHMHPETGFQEKWTTSFIAERLQKLGVSILPWGGETGVVGLLQGEESGPVVALRAEIDALPVQEANDVPYRSTIDGCMHACGHDAHIACLLGAAELLAAKRATLKGSIKFIFQPAEELLAGATRMVEHGVLTNPDVDFIFGLHCMPELEVGRICLKEGPVMACVGSTRLLIQGKGGHGAVPDKAHDPVLAAAAVIQATQSIVSRCVPPREAVVITFGSIHGGTVGNVIPDTVELLGTVRGFNTELFDSLPATMDSLIAHTASAYGTKVDFTFTKVVPSVCNPVEDTNWIREPLGIIFGESGILPATPTMGGEDFALYQQKVPGIYCWFGAGNAARGITHGWHNPHFDIDETALPFAAAAYAQVAHDRLRR